MKPRQYLPPIVGMAVFLLGICSAQASTVVYEDAGVVFNDTVFTKPFDVTHAGPYKAELVDFGAKTIPDDPEPKFPFAFDILSLTITQEDPLTNKATLLGFGFDTGSFTFNVSTPGTLMANLAAIPSVDDKWVPRQGLYALQIKAIPVPAAAWLFFSGLIGLFIVGRRDSGLETV